MKEPLSKELNEYESCYAGTFADEASPCGCSACKKETNNFFKLETKKLVASDMKIQIPPFEDGTPWSFEEAGKRCIDLTNYNWLVEQFKKELEENK